MEESEFIKEVKGVSEPRKHKVTGSLGVYDAYKWYRKHKPKGKEFILSESQYFAIVRRMNEYMRDLLVASGEIAFPCRMGRLEIKKYPVIITTEGKKVKTNLPIDWNETLKLWYEDEECRANKTLVRVNVPELFRIYYNKSKANYNNKSFYQFTPNRELKKLLKHRIKTDAGFDAYIR